MSQQASDGEREALADLVIDNDGAVEQLEEQVAGVWQALERG